MSRLELKERNKTGARVSEAVRLKWCSVDLEKKIAILDKTKTDRFSIRHLTNELVLRISSLYIAPNKSVFYYTEPKSVNRRIKAVCQRANISFRTTHSASRHSFGTNAMIVPNSDIKTAMDARG